MHEFIAPVARHAFESFNGVHRILKTLMRALGSANQRPPVNVDHARTLVGLAGVPPVPYEHKMGAEADFAGRLTSHDPLWSDHDRV